jgi:hypothetical protein
MYGSKPNQTRRGGQAAFLRKLPPYLRALSRIFRVTCIMTLRDEWIKTSHFTVYMTRLADTFKLLLEA